MKKFNQIVFLFLLCLFFLAACNTTATIVVTPTVDVSATITPTLFISASSTPSPTSTLTPLPTSTSTKTPKPSSTMTKTITPTPPGGSTGQMACTASNAVYLVDLNTGKRVMLTDGYSTYLRWSNDGSSLAVQLYPSGICVYDVTKNRDHCIPGTDQLTNGEFAISPDGDWVVFPGPYVPEAKGSLNFYDVWSGGSSTLEIDRRCANDIRGLSWSPDGKGVVFDCLGKVFSINIDGTEKTMLASDSLSHSSSLSPDGKTIAYIRDYLKNAEVYVMPAGGVGKTRKTSNTNVEWKIQWSPDSRRFAFLSFYVFSHSQALGDIVIFDMEANKSFPLTKNSGGWPNFTWSGDSSLIAYSIEGEVTIVNPMNGQKLDVHSGLVCDELAWRP